MEDPNVEVVVRDGMVVARNVVIVVEEVIVVVVETDVTAEDEFVQAASVGKPTVSITVIIAKIILRLNIVFTLNSPLQALVKDFNSQSIINRSLNSYITGAVKITES